jgi:hypothetical protein
MKLFFIVAVLVLSGCGNGESGPQGPFSDPHTVMPTSELPHSLALFP